MGLFHASLAAVTLSATGLVMSVTSPSVAAQVWAPADTAALHPGVQTYTDGGQCTANFVFTDTAGKVYLGQSAHCASTGAATDTDGCTSSSLPLGTVVEFREGGSLLSDGTLLGTGRLVYSSWRSMQAAGEKDADACAYNDFALVEVDPAYVDDVNPSVPFWGGPSGANTAGTTIGEKIYSYGNSSLRAGASQLSPKVGTSLGTVGNGWAHELYSATPGIPGDSGSAFVDAQGQALGTLSTVAIAPLAGSNTIGDLSRELAYAQQHSGIDGLRLVDGTEPFSPAL
jgi:hypothetical protein